MSSSSNKMSDTRPRNSNPRTATNSNGRKGKLLYVRGVVMLLVAACILVSTSILSARTTSPQEDRRVKVINNASSAIYHFYASNVDSESWEEDILGNRTIPPGKSVIINIDDGTGHCYYDLKAVLRDGREAVRRKFNVCTQSSWTVTD
jgi:hypothetical protein